MKKYVKCKMVFLLMACTLALAGCEAADAFAEASTETAVESTEGTETVESEATETESTEAESTESESTESESIETESTEESAKTESAEEESVKMQSTEETGAVNKKANAAKSAGTGANVGANAKADGTGVDGLDDSGVNKSSGSRWNNWYLCDADDGFYKSAAQEIWNYVNAERTANGLAALEWDENTYNFACKRAQEIVTDFSHNGVYGTGYGENILKNYTIDANTLHTQWYNSPGHHENYLNSEYNRGACAVYVKDGVVYAVENFTTPWSNIVGTWTASNGVIIEIYENGNTSVSEEMNPGRTQAEMEAASYEYYGISYPTQSGSAAESSSPTENTTVTETVPETWTASNGVTVYIANGNAYTINDGYSDDAHYQAWLEYTQSH